MELKNAISGGTQTSEQELRNPNNGDAPNSQKNQLFNEEIDSACSTPYVSAPSSPGRATTGYFFSAPASPVHFVLSSFSSSSAYISSSSTELSSGSGSSEFEFSARFPSTGLTPSGSMISADELFLNGQIRPMKLSSHLQRPQILAPLVDLEVEEEDEEDGDEETKESRELSRRDLKLRKNRSLHRRTRSMSPLRRNQPFQWHEGEEEREVNDPDIDLDDPDLKLVDAKTPSVSASTSRSSSSSSRGNSKRWISLKDFLYRSKSEGRSNTKEKFWHSLSFSPSKEKKSPAVATETQKQKRIGQAKKSGGGKPENFIGKRRFRAPSPHELHYTANRAQSEEMKKRTFLPYREGLFGCLGFSSRSYGSAMNGFAKTLNHVCSS